MRLYLVRHGDAKEEVEDPRRPLSDAGRAKVETVAGLAKGLGVRPTRVLHSGKLRAEETAEVIARVLDIGVNPESTEGLAPNDDVRPWPERVAGDRDVMLVGHLPFMEELASLLLCGDHAGRIIEMPTAALVCLEHVGDAEWRLRWILTSELA